VPQKDHVSVSGSQLMSAQPGNITVQCRLEKLSNDWERLIRALHDGENNVHAALMLLLSPQQALNELISWLQSVEKTIREESGKAPDSSADVRCEQEKYRVCISRCSITI